MTNLVFLGAGASRPFGIPTMQEMVADFESELRNDNTLYDFYLRVKNVLIEKYGDSEIDIEAMLSVFSGISDKIRPVQMGHFLCYYVSKNCTDDKFSDDEIKSANELKLKLQDYIKNKCGTHIEQTDVYKISYLPFFQHMEGNKHDYDGTELCRDWKAYTTNYDNIFEDFWRQLESPLDHFKKSTKSNKYIFNTEPLSESYTFSKLHGSLDWTKEVSSGKIVRTKHATYSPIETEGEIMLFPIQQKDLYLHPWFTLFWDLKIGLSYTQKWYVIGYAFNDEFIRNVFQESLVDDPSKKLILINPEAGEIKNKFSDKVRNQIEALPIRFGSEQFEIQFREYIENVKTIVMKFKTTPSTTEHTIRIESNNIIKQATILSANTGWEVFPPRDNLYGDALQSTYIKIKNQKYNEEVKLELKIPYKYGNKLKLFVSDDTQKLYFAVDYNNKTIFRPDQIERDVIPSGDRTSEFVQVKLNNADLCG